MSFTDDFDGFTGRLREFIRASEGEVQKDDREIKPGSANDRLGAPASLPACCSSANLAGQDAGAPGRDSRSGDGFASLARQLFALQFKYNAPYRRFCEARGSRPGIVEHWTAIPAMPTSAFKELEISCLPIGERKAVFYSSGTTEHRPSMHFHNAESLAIYEESVRSWFGWR